MLKNLYAPVSHDKIPGVEDLTPGIGPRPRSVRKIYVLLPAYNEASVLTQLIPNLVQQLKKTQHPFEILVVNDGSTDGTSRILGELPQELATREIRHDHNRGYGAALKTGFLWIAEHAGDSDAVVSMDADNTQNPAYIPSLISKLEEGHDVVTASYMMLGGHSTGLPILRRVMSTVVNRLFRWSIGIPHVETYTNGFRAFRVSAILKARQKYADGLILEAGFPGGAEFFLKIVGTGARVAEVPFDLHYEHRGSGSKIHLMATIWRYLQLIVIGRRYA